MYLATTTPPAITDDFLNASVTAQQAVGWMREAVVAAEQGRLQAPPRTHTDLGTGRLVFTTGALDGVWFGYRSYDTFGLDRGQQIVVVHSARTGSVLGIAVGNTLGQLRTGALGGLAVDMLARPNAATLGVIGTGPQAWRQVWAAAAVRPISAVSVHSRTPAHATRFAGRLRDHLGIEAVVEASAWEAVRDRDIVVLATTSTTPILDPAWLSPGTHVTTVGPKQAGSAELGLDLVDAADLVVTDSLAQLHGYDPPSIVADSHHAERVRSLGAVVTGTSPGRRSATDVTLYLSVGLAGTEVHLLHRLLTHTD